MAPWTTQDIPDQQGRVALITGANSGIGLDAARALARHGAKVVLACRNRTKAETARDAIVSATTAADVEILDLDLSDLESVRIASKTFLAQHQRLDLLINNAGIMGVAKRTTVDGFESQLGTNHLGHFAFTANLIDTLLATEGSRVVNVSSLAHQMGFINFDNLQYDKRYSAWLAYGRSKLANLLFTYELQRRLTATGHNSTIAVAAHPGGSNTNLAHDVAGIGGFLMRFAEPLVQRTMQSSEMGSLPTLRAAIDTEANGGDYYGPDGFMEQQGHPVKVKSNKRSHDPAVARKLWDLSCELTQASWPALKS